MEKLTIIKVGGKIVEEKQSLEQLLDSFAAIQGNKLLVHGGGRSATQIAGLVNKNIVAQLQARHINAMGLTGADLNVIQSHKRLPNPIDFGFVGDVDKVNGKQLANLISTGIVPIMAPLTHDCEGHLLNTNADTIAGEVAKALTPYYNIRLIFCFEMAGVMQDVNDEQSVIPHINATDFKRLVDNGTIQGGMIPKIQNAIDAIDAGVEEVIITKASAIDCSKGTKITK